MLDLGVKTSTLNYLAERGFDVHVLPQYVTAEEILAHRRPTRCSSRTVPATPRHPTTTSSCCAASLRDGLPFFGICFGNQLLGRALGFGTYKLPFGHRGINQPVLDKATGRVEITAHNHGFAVDAPIDGVSESAEGFGRVEVSHYDLNDNVVEGLNCLDIPAFSVQYHPESAAGPHDANYLFDRFRDMVVASKEDQRLMPKRDDINCVLVIGSGPIVIGQACEFDYSGTQACRVLREEGVRVILVNSNPATIMTDPDFADATYIEPITLARSSRRSSPRRGPTRSCRPSAARPR